MATSSSCYYGAELRCNTCSGVLSPVEEDTVYRYPLTYWCHNCEQIYGIDDTCSDEQWYQETGIPPTASEESVPLRTTMCRKCSNDDVDKFILELNDSQLLTRCLTCGTTEVIADTTDTPANNGEPAYVAEFPIVCDCTNGNPDLFDVHSSPDGRLTIFQCHVCFTEFSLSDDVPGTGSEDHNKGDHIFWNKSLGYSHHAIVSDKSEISGQVKVIHYTGGLLEGAGKGVIAEEWLDAYCDKDILYRQDYVDCHDPEEVIRLARSRLGERKYSLPFNNCEHFACWCKTGFFQSDQVDGVISSIKATSNNITSAHKFSDLASSALKDVSSLKKDDYLKIGIVGSELLAVGEDLGKAYLQMMTKGHLAKRVCSGVDRKG
ncbi:hypothetical protein LSH36_610g00008 [Paralvinella palmiformis]|uniref:LRAT domain-containing protein n=1 Tax=Paralvinella palmiformis TaxID=53620 RepID=A0AAD9MWI2_9ANNE|nr:hypothetical protein LSH36_610g00008 [Paralvinella palmiformis]